MTGDRELVERIARIAWEPMDSPEMVALVVTMMTDAECARFVHVVQSLFQALAARILHGHVDFILDHPGWTRNDGGQEDNREAPTDPVQGLDGAGE